MMVPARHAMLLAATLLAPCAASAQPTPISVEQAWARATPGGGQEGSLYLTLRSAADDRLASVSTPVAGMAMMHETREAAGVVQMRDVAGLALPAGQSVAMRPGGVHVMLMGLAHPLRLGERFPVTLTFDHAAAVTATVTVTRAGASNP